MVKGKGTFSRSESRPKNRGSGVTALVAYGYIEDLDDFPVYAGPSAECTDESGIESSYSVEECRD